MLVEKNLNFESCKTFSKTEESEIHVLRKRDCIFDKKTCLKSVIIKLHQIIQREQHQNIYLKDEKEVSRNHSSKHLRQ